MTKMAECYPHCQLSISQGFATDAAIASQQHQQQQHRQVPEVLKKKQEITYQQFQPQGLSSFIPSTTVATAVTNNVTEAAAAASVSKLIAAAKNHINTPKNYFVPLHVDCSVEYELPKQPKPPAGQRVEPLLMIHPCYFRKMESQRRSPFINNMPNSSRNGAMFVGVALVAQDSNNASTSCALSSKRTSLRNHQHHYNTRQNISTQYDLTSSSDQQQHQQQQQQQMHKIQTRQHHKPQESMSLMPQQERYAEASVKCFENPSTPIQRTAITIVNPTNQNQILSSALQNKKKKTNLQQDYLVQNSSLSSKGANNQWNQLTTVKPAVADRNPNTSGSFNNVSNGVECFIVSSSNLRKRDAMISGTGLYSNVPSNNISLRIQMNKSAVNNNIHSSEKKNDIIETNRNCLGTSTCLVDATKLPWNSKTHNTPSLFMIDQNPIATVPSNYQAGPDIAPKTKPLNKNTYRTIIDNNVSVNKNDVTTNNSEKFRHYLRSHRVHPYIPQTPSSSSSSQSHSVLAVSSKSQKAARGNFQVLSHITAAIPDEAPMSTATSFQQNMQQITCYNV